MEMIFLTCMAIAYFFTKSKVDTAAYANGKEPPGVTKARLRHESGGGARSSSGKPKGKGAARLFVASKWANACESARQRSEHKARRRRDWYETEVAPREDEAYKAKQLAKLEKADKARAHWASRPLIDLVEHYNRKDEDEAWKENTRRDAEAAEQTKPAPTGHDPLHPADAVELDQFADQYPDVARYADSKGRKSGGQNSADWYDAVRRIRDATIAEEAKDASTDDTTPAEFPLCTDPDDRFGGTVPLSKEHAELIDGELPCWWEGGPPPARRPEVPCPELRVPGYPFCPTHTAEHNRMAATSSTAKSVEEMVNEIAVICGKPAEAVGVSDFCAWIYVDDTQCKELCLSGERYCEEHEEIDKLPGREAARATCQWNEGRSGHPTCSSQQLPGSRYCKRHKPESQTESQPAPDAGKQAPNNNSEGSSMYMDAVAKLNAAADQVAQFQANLSAFADTLDGKKWGEQVVGPMQDLNSQLTALNGEYRDLAAQMKHQGDQGATAHEQAPWVPADDSILA